VEYVCPNCGADIETVNLWLGRKFLGEYLIDELKERGLDFKVVEVLQPFTDEDSESTVYYCPECSKRIELGSFGFKGSYAFELEEGEVPEKSE